MRTILLATAGALLLAAPAAAGGWATAGLGPPPPGTGAGDTWNATMTILQHGQTPLVGVQPAVIITQGSKTLRFDAKPTGKPGVYTAKVEFPTDGTWRYAVYDGFTEYGQAKLHTFAPVEIGGTPASGGFSVPEWVFGLGFAALGLAVIALIARRGRPTVEPVGQP